MSGGSTLGPLTVAPEKLARPPRETFAYGRILGDNVGHREVAHSSDPGAFAGLQKAETGGGGRSLPRDEGEGSFFIFGPFFFFATSWDQT